MSGLPDRVTPMPQSMYEEIYGAQFARDVVHGQSLRLFSGTIPRRKLACCVPGHARAVWDREFAGIRLLHHLPPGPTAYESTGTQPTQPYSSMLQTRLVLYEIDVCGLQIGGIWGLATLHAGFLSHTVYHYSVSTPTLRATSSL
ncbi:hypothetical protein PC9H_010327 [Pleurotus ostreatus]|uniref:Uncharacterized protein n=1 Tax=Pleurotus ostreatus TaxID=5322 RepID=A0A8H6ZSW6_PLEOS|nr:uncharacterized protein PC9H_010327 [Pleurotus ostreatus]KAF7425016.1 hypothetical protein PC9H_010327 [Pleurotus ostreatus]